MNGGGIGEFEFELESECRDSVRDVLRVCRDAQHERMPSLGWCIAVEGLSSCDEAEWWLDDRDELERSPYAIGSEFCAPSKKR